MASSRYRGKIVLVWYSLYSIIVRNLSMSNKCFRPEQNSGVIRLSRVRHLSFLHLSWMVCRSMLRESSVLFSSSSAVSHKLLLGRKIIVDEYAYATIFAIYIRQTVACPAFTLRRLHATVILDPPLYSELSTLTLGIGMANVQ